MKTIFIQIWLFIKGINALVMGPDATEVNIFQGKKISLSIYMNILVYLGHFIPQKKSMQLPDDYEYFSPKKYMQSEHLIKMNSLQTLHQNYSV